MIHKIYFALIFLSPIIVGICMLFVGGSDLDIYKGLQEIYQYIFLNQELGYQGSILLDIRLPRVLLAIFIGASICGAGAIMQNIFRNFLVDPFLLGISSGAALGCAVSIGFFPNIPVFIFAFIGAILSSLFVLFIGKMAGSSNIVLVLSGVVLSTFLSAFTGLIIFFVEPIYAQNISIWLIGSLSLSKWSDVASVLIAFLLCFVPLYLLRWKINILSLSDEEAYSLGINVNKMKFIIMLLLSLVCAVCVSLVGVVGWIGLVVPHIARTLVGVDMKILLLACFSLGGSMLLLGDGIARGISSYDLPVGAINAIIFSPIFIFLLYKYIRKF